MLLALSLIANAKGDGQIVFETLADPSDPHPPTNIWLVGPSMVGQEAGRVESLVVRRAGRGKGARRWPSGLVACSSFNRHCCLVAD